MTERIAIIGAGLAGCEAAWQLASRNIPVDLFEMRPQKSTEAHQTGDPAELVCSNSLKSIDITNAHGLLKAELERANSIVVWAAKKSSIPAGSALAVDRKLFSATIKQALQLLKDFQYLNEEVKDINTLKKKYKKIILAAGPLMSDSLAESLMSKLGDQGLYFYDAIAPVVYTESLDHSVVFKASRYGKGTADYFNCPMDKSDYFRFVEDLKSSKKVPFKEFEQAKHFEGCLPIEVMAERGIESLSFGPLKPVGLIDPRNNQQPHAVLQLRQENQEATLFNLVGCQTRMTWPEQKRVFCQIPGLEKAEFARYGSMHRNTYINAPIHLDQDLSLKKDSQVYLAGQITGVEGYIESTAMGLWAALNVFETLNNSGQSIKPSNVTMIGALIIYLQEASPDNFQPMNANFGLIAPLAKKIKNKKEKRGIQAELALETWEKQIGHLKIPMPKW